MRMFFRTITVENLSSKMTCFETEKYGTFPSVKTTRSESVALYPPPRVFGQNLCFWVKFTFLGKIYSREFVFKRGSQFRENSGFKVD